MANKLVTHNEIIQQFDNQQYILAPITKKVSLPYTLDVSNPKYSTLNMKIGYTHGLNSGYAGPSALGQTQTYYCYNYFSFTVSNIYIKADCVELHFSTVKSQAIKNDSRYPVKNYIPYHSPGEDSKTSTKSFNTNFALCFPYTNTNGVIVFNSNIYIYNKSSASPAKIYISETLDFFNFRSILLNSVISYTNVSISNYYETKNLAITYTSTGQYTTATTTKVNSSRVSSGNNRNTTEIILINQTTPKLINSNNGIIDLGYFQGNTGYTLYCNGVVDKNLPTTSSKFNITTDFYFYETEYTGIKGVYTISKEPIYTYSNTITSSTSSKSSQIKDNAWRYHTHLCRVGLNLSSLGVTVNNKDIKLNNYKIGEFTSNTEYFLACKIKSYISKDGYGTGVASNGSVNTAKNFYRTHISHTTRYNLSAFDSVLTPTYFTNNIATISGTNLATQAVLSDVAEYLALNGNYCSGRLTSPITLSTNTSVALDESILNYDEFTNNCTYLDSEYLNNLYNETNKIVAYKPTDYLCKQLVVNNIPENKCLTDKDFLINTYPKSFSISVYETTRHGTIFNHNYTFDKIVYDEEEGFYDIYYNVEGHAGYIINTYDDSIEEYANNGVWLNAISKSDNNKLIFKNSKRFSSTLNTFSFKYIYLSNSGDHLYTSIRNRYNIDLANVKLEDVNDGDNLVFFVQSSQTVI